MGELLNQVLADKNLAQAWQAVARNQGMPGVDEVSIRRWRRNWEEQIKSLARAVRTQRYHPSKLRCRRIPKRNRREFRTLLIPTVSDRVLQRAVLQVLHPICDVHFLDCSFGYRPGRGLTQAVQQILILREAGLRWLLDADIDACFDSIQHALLLRQIEAWVTDPALVDLIAAWLQIGAADGVGIAMGSPLSPLLANIYLHPFDQRLTRPGWHLIRYADDFIVLTRAAVNLDPIYRETEAALAEISLRLDPRKSHPSDFETGFTFLGVNFKGDSYEYSAHNKTVEVHGATVDGLFKQFGPSYDQKG